MLVHDKPGIYLHAIHNSLQAVLDLAVEYYVMGISLISGLAIAIMFAVIYTEGLSQRVLTSWMDLADFQYL